MVLPGPAGDRPLPAVRGEVPAGQVVVIAYSSDGEAVLGWPRAGVQMVPVPPAWMAEIIGAADGYARWRARDLPGSRAGTDIAGAGAARAVPAAGR